MTDTDGTILVAGLGNELLSDDGVGIHACRRLASEAEARGRTDVVIAEIGTAVIEALHLLERAELILGIDAMQAGGAPGTVYLASADELESSELVSLHQLSLLGALQMVEAEASGRLAEPWKRPAVEILGVEPAQLSLGMTLSTPVAASLPQVCEQVWRLIDGRTAG
ncbi:MAG: hydrogenase maturation protease [Deltaproteobacteria bacterium]|jgi:hydrogenase maturation protease|nr:hydrogenase maturation protease [Deltaproteobacteria bacterium]MBW2536529.1 hydrogenase maturation protease [Deltaproteobacteria bacterium]